MDAAIEQSLRSLLVDIDAQIGTIVDEAREMNIAPARLRNMDGTAPLSPLLLAKAQALNGLAVLSAKKK